MIPRKTNALTLVIPANSPALRVLLLCVLLSFCTASWAQTKTRQVPVESLIYDLKNPDANRRKEAATLLGINRIERAVPDLVAAAGDPDADVRRAIVESLDKMLDVRSLPAFVNLSSDTEKDIREKCIRGLINLYLPQESGLVVTLNKVANFFNPWSDEWGDVVVEPDLSVDPRAVAALRGRLQDSEEGIRAQAARALGILKGSDAVPVLLDTLRHDRSNGVRFEAVRALRKIADVSVAPEVMNYVGYNESKIRNESIYTLGRFRYRQAVPELTRLYERESALPSKQAERSYREALFEALAAIADPSSKELFVKETQARDEAIRLYAYEGLAHIGDAALATDISRDRLRERDEKVKTVMAYALFRMGRKEYLDEIVRGLDSRKTNREARKYLLELRPDELPELYVQTATNDADIREALAEIIGLIGNRDAIPALQELSNDRRGQVAAFANQAMRRINARTINR